MTFFKTSGRLPAILRLVIVVTLMIVPARSTVSHAETKLGVDLGAEVEIEPEGRDLDHEASSELGLIYETGPFYLESETELEPEGFSDQGFVLGFTGDELSGETDLDFDTEQKQLDSCEFSGALDQGTKTFLEASYETDNCPLKSLRQPERELEIVVERRIAESVTTEVSSTFSEESGSLVSIPEESEVEIDDLPFGNYRVNPVLEMEELVPAKIEVDFERVVPLLESPRMDFEGDLEWETSEEYVEFVPELASDLASLTLESELSFAPAGPNEILRIQELELDDLELGEWGLELALDFADEEAELDLETDADRVEFGLEFLFENFGGDSRPEAGRIGGETSLSLDERTEVTIGGETEFESPYPELSLALGVNWTVGS